jgi:hypothetical protein
MIDASVMFMLANENTPADRRESRATNSGGDHGDGATDAASAANTPTRREASTSRMVYRTIVGILCPIDEGTGVGPRNDSSTPGSIT